MEPHQFLLLAISLFGLGAVLSLALSRSSQLSRVVSGITGTVASVAGIVSAVLALRNGGSPSINMAGAAPFGHFIIQIDGLSGLMVGIISLVSAATCLYSISYLKEYEKRNLGVIGFFNNIFLAAMLLVVTISNAFYFLIFWELMTLASYFLVIFDQENRDSIQAGYIYFLMAHAGTALIMVSFLLLYSNSGNFDFSAMRQASLSPLTRDVVFLLAFLGFGTKAGMVPVHIWLPRAHPAAPSHISALMSGVMIKTAIYGIIRLSVDILGATIWWWGFTILALGAISAVIGVLYAMSEYDIKRLLAYSSVENIGIILMGLGVGMIGLASQQSVLAVVGLLAALYHLVNHALFKGLLFLGAGSAIYRTHTKNMNEMGGLVHKMPWTSLAFLIGAVSMSALPPLNGFVSEWFTYQSLFIASAGSQAVLRVFGPVFAVMLTLASATAAMCYVNAYGVTFTGPSRAKHTQEIREVPVTMGAGMAVLAVGCLFLGLGSPVVVPIISNVVTTLLKTSPVSFATGMSVFSIDGSQTVLSTPLITILLAALLALPLILAGIFGGLRAGQRKDETAWAAGYQYNSRMAISSSGFGQLLRAFFGPFYRIRTPIDRMLQTTGSAAKNMVKPIARLENFWDHYILRPLGAAVQNLGKRIQVLQTGDIRVYCLYIVLTLAVLLIVAVR